MRVVSNSPFRAPVRDRVQRVVVSDGINAADDWTAERADNRSVVVTCDVLLTGRFLRARADAETQRARIQRGEHRQRDRARDRGGFARGDGWGWWRPAAVRQGGSVTAFPNAGPGAGGDGGAGAA